MKSMRGSSLFFLAAALLVAIYLQVDLEELSVWVSIDLVDGECEIYFNKGRDIWDLTCSPDS